MLKLLFFTISLIASTVGGICGVGGGVIIKPTLDAFGVISVSAVSFLSGCTVLVMSLVSFYKNRKQKGVLEFKISTPLAIGAVFGGLLGKWMFELLKTMLADEALVGAVQAALLLIITVGTLLYSIFAKKIKTNQLQNTLACGLIGLMLGTISAFLGIGGGPINLTVLYFFFSMDTKKAAANSLYIILFSQLSSLVQTILTKSVPTVDLWLLLLMLAGGIIGGLLGNKIYRKISSRAVEYLFGGFMILIILINIYNILRFTLLG